MRLYQRRAGQIGGAAIVVGLAVLVSWSFAISWYPSPKSYPFQGPSVSAANGVIEWPVIRGGGAAFAYLTATIGADGRDASFQSNWSDVYAAGLRRGAIHVYSLCRLAADQANNFNTNVPYTGDSLPPAIAIDFEPGCTARPERDVVIGEVTRLITMIETHTRKPVLLKVSRRFDEKYRITAAIERPIWSSQNFFPPDYAARPWRMWQASDLRRMDGAPTLINWNVVAP
ncbi:glycoside hydrolase family 25 protein [Sphingomonas sp. 32-62-10]|uniref:glycoside hydrolase family 25 protein n=1 Tax=Sphingomonas sp. 32-62-10 TaxID=1970436 RepID=UPI000BD250B4|nr:MAG: glycosyl hydrolase [Sphingomonas sp. 12-62-6]OYX39921.1 MAG: glycosyl hydrolase [Sphingomonas sp. 32-62-10]